MFLKFTFLIVFLRDVIKLSRTPPSRSQRRTQFMPVKISMIWIASLTNTIFPMSTFSSSNYVNWREKWVQPLVPEENNASNQSTFNFTSIFEFSIFVSKKGREKCWPIDRTHSVLPGQNHSQGNGGAGPTNSEFYNRHNYNLYYSKISEEAFSPVSKAVKHWQTDSDQTKSAGSISALLIFVRPQTSRTSRNS